MQFHGQKRNPLFLTAYDKDGFDALRLATGGGKRSANNGCNDSILGDE
jgi:hypothetical protein